MAQTTHGRISRIHAYHNSESRYYLDCFVENGEPNGINVHAYSPDIARALGLASLFGDDVEVTYDDDGIEKIVSDVKYVAVLGSDIRRMFTRLVALTGRETGYMVEYTPDGSDGDTCDSDRVLNTPAV